MTTFICVNFATGFHAGTYIGEAPPPANAEQFFVREEAFPSFTPDFKLINIRQEGDGEAAEWTGDLVPRVAGGQS